MKKESLSKESYKGVRDFYPPDQAVQDYILSTMRNVVKRYGYEEISASVLEPSDLYRAKTGDEIVNEQTYNFEDRGGREVTLRPEMTPTVARMIAARRRDLVTPIRWFSIPNLFRYEKPQRGRTREHWQLNADIFGVKSLQAEVEIIAMMSDILKEFGLKDKDFTIKINNRKLINYLLNDLLELNESDAYNVSKLIDKKDKITEREFDKEIEKYIKVTDANLNQFLNSENYEEIVRTLPDHKIADAGLDDIKEVIESLENLGITNIKFDQTLMRGFDYYTGIVFEIFDNNPKNNRSLFGGGRYDDLLTIFGENKIPAVGFGMGDLTIKDVLETYDLLPEVCSDSDVSICIADNKAIGFANDVAQFLRENCVNVAVDYTEKKIGDQIRNADKKGVKYVIVIGEKEMQSGKVKVKELESGDEKEFEARDEKLAEYILNIEL